jgi:hypothetical protein
MQNKGFTMLTPREKLQIQKFTVRDWTAHGKWRPLGCGVRRAA